MLPVNWVPPSVVTTLFWHAKVGNPRRYKLIRNHFSSYALQGGNLWPPGSPVDNCEEVHVALLGAGQGPKDVHVHVGIGSFWDWNWFNWGLLLPRNFHPGAVLTILTQCSHLSGHATPHIAAGDHSLGSSGASVRQSMHTVEDRFSPGGRYHWSKGAS